MYKIAGDWSGFSSCEKPSPAARASSSSMPSTTSLVALTCLTIAAAAPSHHRKRDSRGASPTKNIAELATATPQLSTLLAAVKAAGLVETLAGEGPFTVFAPTNKAFAKIPKTTLDGLLADKDALTAVLLRHVVPGAALKAEDVPEGDTKVKTAGGEEITVSRTRFLKIKSAKTKTGVAAFDILATNGVVHLVNDVI